jgi:hypothetical protein
VIIRKVMLLLIFFFLNILISVIASCPNGSIASLSDPTKCYFYETQKMNFIVANQNCVENGGNLVSIHDMLDNVVISSEASSFFTDSTSIDFWIGANDLYTPGVWTWMDKTPFDFTDWDKGQPQNVSGANCGAAKILGGQWIAEGCYEMKPFVCLITTATITTTTTKIIPTTTTTKIKTCEKDWSPFGGFCYKVFDPRTWYEAEQMCVIENATLASIHNLQEALFVANLAYYPGSDSCDGSKQAWIGLFTDDTFISYKWTDGTPFDYQKWGTNHPYKVAPNYCNVLSLAPICGNVTGAFYADPCDTFDAKFVCKKGPS